MAFLEWVEIAGAWAGLFASGGGGPARGNRTAGKTGATARTPPPPVTRAPGVSYPTNYPGREAFASTVNQGGGTLNTTGASAINRINRYDAATQARLRGSNAEIIDFLARNPNAPFAEKVKVIQSSQAKWGIDEILE